MISILKSPWSLLCLGPFCPLVPFVPWSLLAMVPFVPWSLLVMVPFGHGPFWVLVPFGWSLLAGPFWPVPFGLVPFDFQRSKTEWIFICSIECGAGRDRKTKKILARRKSFLGPLFHSSLPQSSFLMFFSI